MRLKILAPVISLLLLCSCGPASLSGAGTESLLTAPKLNKRQAQVSEDLETSLQLRSIVYKYPQSGEYRSPFIFFDLDGDDKEEAVVLYSYTNEASGEVRAKVMSQNQDSSWLPVYDVPLQTSQVEFVEFRKLLSETSSCMLVGAGSVSRKPPYTLQIYSMSDGEFKLEANPEYYSYSVKNFNSDKLSELIVIGRDNDHGGFNANLFRGVDGHIESISTLALSSDVETPLGLTTGNFEGGHALYIDELLSGGQSLTIATEVIKISPDGLTSLVGGDIPPRGEPQTPARSNYEVTFRDEEIYCMDLDGDGTVEIPYPVSLPGPLESTVPGTPKLFKLMNLTASGFDIRNSAVINTEAGYLVYFPERWLDNVVVEIDRENSEWHFRKWNADILEPAEELLRVRVSSTRDYLDLFEEYTELAVRGVAAYTAYIPKIEGEPLAVTESDVRGMFRLLPA